MRVTESVNLFKEFSRTIDLTQNAIAAAHQPAQIVKLPADRFISIASMIAMQGVPVEEM